MGFDKNCIELLSGAPKRHSRHCFRSALNHLERANMLREHDLEMCIFRAITAEEEAATGLMMCLKERGYKNSEKLKQRDHTHKNAVVPFLSILGIFFEESFGLQGIKPFLHIQEQDGERRLTIGIPMVVDGLHTHAYPIPPLNLSISSNDRPPSYTRQIAAYVENTQANGIVSHIKEQANLRNKVLYAHTNGYPKVTDLPSEFLATRENRVLAMLKAYLLIFPYREIQPFVQDTLDAFLAMLGVLENHGLHEEF